MNHGSLFSGIGGFDLAATFVGWKNAFHCEWNEYGQSVLKHHDPKAMTYEDITKTNFTIWRGRIDVLTGGFPCQPYSTAGKRKGTEDERHLWPEMLRAIREIQPRWIVGENVLGIVNWNGGMVFEEVQAQLEAEGYEVFAYVLPAAGVNAPHQRYRTWFVAYSNQYNDSGRPERHESKSKEKRLQKRHSVRKPSQSNNLRRFVAYSDKRTKRSPGTSRKAKSNGSKNNDEPKSGRVKTKQYFGRCKFLRATSNAYHTGTRKPVRSNGNRKTKNEGRKRQPQLKYRKNGYNGATSNAKRSGKPGQLFYKPRKGQFRGQSGATSTNASNQRLQRGKNVRGIGRGGKESNEQSTGCVRDHWKNFPTQPPVRSGNDGLPTESLRQRIRADSMGLLSEEEIDSILSKATSKWVKETIKAGGNAVVPPLVVNIFNSINAYEKKLFNKQV